jgi:hypothetical protein
MNPRRGPSCLQVAGRTESVCLRPSSNVVADPHVHDPELSPRRSNLGKQPDSRGLANTA